MPIQLGDFFASAPYARPVNPKPVSFTAISRAKVLPGGTQNPTGRPVAATITAAFIFLGGEGTSEARVDARSALRKRFVDPESKSPLPTDEDDFDIELTFQMLQRVVREWDADQRTAGEPLFPSVTIARQLLEMVEANRLMRAYNAYVLEEHPEAVDRKSFPDAQGGGEGVAPSAPR